MIIEIITPGDEVLTGFTVDTNASWLSLQLLEQGWQVRRRQTVGDRKPEVLCEDWLKLNWAFDENTPPVVFPTACINDPNTFTPQLRFDPRWHLVRPGAIALEQNPYEQVETFHPVTWGMPAHTVNTD